MKLDQIKRKYYQSFDLTDNSRELLKKHFVPKYHKFIGHHITYMFDVDPAEGAPDAPFDVKVVGYVDDGKGVEALVVFVDTGTKRPDGKTYHITWSLGANRKPVESNAAIEQFGFQKLDNPIPIEVTPALH